MNCKKPLTHTTFTKIFKRIAVSHAKLAPQIQSAIGDINASLSNRRGLGYSKD